MEVKNNLNINNKIINNNQNSQDNNLNINVNDKKYTFNPLNSKIADSIGYLQDAGSSLLDSIQDLAQEKPDFMFKTIAENLKDKVISGVYKEFSQVVDKLMLGALRGVTLALSGWQFIKKLKEKEKIQKAIEEKTLQIQKEIESLTFEQRQQLLKEIEKLSSELDEKKLELGLNGGKIITDLLGVVGAVASTFTLLCLSKAAPYLIGMALVGDIFSLSYLHINQQKMVYLN